MAPAVQRLAMQPRRHTQLLHKAGQQAVQGRSVPALALLQLRGKGYGQLHVGGTVGPAHLPQLVHTGYEPLDQHLLQAGQPDVLGAVLLHPPLPALALPLPSSTPAPSVVCPGSDP